MKVTASSFKSYPATVPSRLCPWVEKMVDPLCSLLHPVFVSMLLVFTITLFFAFSNDNTNENDARFIWNLTLQLHHESIHR